MMDDAAFEQHLALEVRREAGPSGPVDDLAISDAVARRVAQRRYTLFDAMRLVAAGAIVALFVGLMLPGVLLSPSGDSTGTGTSPTGEPAIHWRSDVVDLQADGMTLQIGDEVYTTEGADVHVLASDGGLGSWALYPRWIENGQNNWLYLQFKSDGESWTVRPRLAFDATVRTAPAPVPEGAILPSMSHSVVFDGRQAIQVPLGEVFTGDWRLESQIMAETCDSAEPVPVAVTLTFENLRLAVSPREPSVLVSIDDRLFHPGSMLGDLVSGSIEYPSTRILGCPDPVVAG